MDVTKNYTTGSREIQNVRCFLQQQQVLRVTRDWGEKIPLSGKKYLGSVSLKRHSALAGCCLLRKVLRCNSTARRRFDLIECIFLFARSSGLMLSSGRLTWFH